MDTDYLLLLQNFRNSCGETFTAHVAHLSDAIPYGTVYIALLLFWSWKKEDGIRCIFSIYLSIAMASVVKLTACIYRPWILDDRIKPPAFSLHSAGNYSFPSGHVASATGSYGFMAYAYGKKFFFSSACVFFILFEAYSRNLVGVHTFKDVLAGFVCGAVGIFFSVSALNWAEKKRNRDVVILVVSILFTAVSLFYITNKTYPLDCGADGKLLVDPAKMIKTGWNDIGMFTGAVLGWFLEKRFVRFTIPSSRLVRALRWIIGTGLYSVFFFVIKGAYLPDGMNVNFAVFLRQVIDIVFFLFVYPAIFTAFEKKFLHKLIACEQ